MITTRDAVSLDINDRPPVDMDAAGDRWRVILIPLGITPRRPRLVSEHDTECEAIDAAVHAAAGITGWSTDVLSPAASRSSQ